MYPPMASRPHLDWLGDISVSGHRAKHPPQTSSSGTVPASQRNIAGLQAQTLLRVQALLQAKPRLQAIPLTNRRYMHFTLTCRQDAVLPLSRLSPKKLDAAQSSVDPRRPGPNSADVI
jgi:hypothetical protein